MTVFIEIDIAVNEIQCKAVGLSGVYMGHIGPCGGVGIASAVDDYLCPERLAA